MLRHSPSCGGLHGFRQAQEFALEMVEGIFSVIQRSPVGERIVGIKQNGVQGAGDGEDPRQANRPKRLETVGVWTIFASSVRGGIAALKLCASIAWLTAA